MARVCHSCGHRGHLDLVRVRVWLAPGVERWAWECRNGDACGARMRAKRRLALGRLLGEIMIEAVY